MINFIWIILLMVGAVTTKRCLRGTCFCEPLSHIVYCARMNLPAMPALPEGTLKVNLTGNHFHNKSIHRYNLTNYGSLKRLFMSDCGIETIDIDTFVDLVNLRWLDISNNNLSVLQENTFRDLRLSHLFLNGNRGLELLPMSFAGLVTSSLYLHNCTIVRLQVEVLTPLNGTLIDFWLNDNQLKCVDQRLASILATIAHVRLGSNPLHCNCEVLWLKEYFDENNETFEGAEPPRCQSPARIKGKHFSELSLFDFDCQSPAIGNCDGDPTPSIFSVQYDPPTTTENNRNERVFNLIRKGALAQNLSHTDGLYIQIWSHMTFAILHLYFRYTQA